MKTLQKLCAAALLTLFVAVSAFAEGQVDCPPVVQPPSATAAGQVDCPPMAQTLLITLETVLLLS